MTAYEHLQIMKEPVPPWLKNFKEGDAFDYKQFFSSRIVYYPGSGTDGHPVKLFGSSHSAHSFVYVDYGINQDFLEKELGHPEHGFQGYHNLSRINLTESDLLSEKWTTHCRHSNRSSGHHRNIDQSFGFIEILERDQSLGDDYGAHRLAILFLGADGIATYDALFCQTHSISAPFALIIQDHGFGGNYDRFDQGGILEGIAKTCNVFPNLLLVAQNSKPWISFNRIPEVDGDCGGMHGHLRFLYKYQ
jgi:hypothetical protein